MVLEIQQGPGDFWVHHHRSLVRHGFTEGTRTMEWRRGPSPEGTMGDAWAVHACPPDTDHWLGTGPVHTQLLMASSCSPAADSAQQTCGWIWKVPSVSVYFLFQTLGILTFIVQSPFMASIRKNKFIYTDFYLQKGNKTSLLSAYEAKTASRYANRSTDTFRCSWRKRGPAIWHHKVGPSITQSPQGSCLTL